MNLKHLFLKRTVSHYTDQILNLACVHILCDVGTDAKVAQSFRLSPFLQLARAFPPRPFQILAALSQAFPMVVDRVEESS